jgi:hypothetical protein
LQLIIFNSFFHHVNYSYDYALEKFWSLLKFTLAPNSFFPSGNC